jgi:hypothetical protein
MDHVNRRLAGSNAANGREYHQPGKEDGKYPIKNVGCFCRHSGLVGFGKSVGCRRL